MDLSNLYGKYGIMVRSNAYYERGAKITASCAGGFDYQDWVDVDNLASSQQSFWDVRLG